jgi:hypothetical protein
MKSFQMKALSLAVLALAGFGMAGSAFALCPTIAQPAVSSSPGGGGAWSHQFIGGTVPAYMDIDSTGGMNGTSCALKVSLSASSNSAALVKDDSPNNEQRIRVRFYLDLNNLITAGFNNSNQAAVIHRMTDAAAPFSSDQLVVRVAGAISGSPTVRFAVSDLNAASHITSVAVPLPASANNQYRIEYDMQIGSGSTTPVPGLPALPAGCTAMPAAGNGCIRMWVSDAAATSTDTAPDASITFNDSTSANTPPGWSGADVSSMGMQSGSPGFRTNHAGTVVRFDEYDSRRQTFIGK